MDCLAPEEDGTGLRVLGTTFFDFDNGRIVSQGETTVQPTLWGSDGYTHITGAISNIDGENAIIAGYDDFECSTGPVRLSGAVNMDNFPTIEFNCIFILFLEDDCASTEESSSSSSD